MANPLDRTWFNTLIDDDGSGSTGTIWNKAQVDGLLDTVDGSLAGLVDKIGTPAIGQLAFFNDADTLGGDPGLVYQATPGAIALIGASNYTAIQLTDNSQPANQRTFKIVNSSGALQLIAIDDAGTQQAWPIVITHAGLVQLPWGQLVFPTTQNPSADPYTFDDYREVDWTPAFGATGGASGQSYSQQIGKAIKIGRKVTCAFQLGLSVLGTFSGGLRVTGLPYPAATTPNAAAGSMTVTALSPLTGSVSYVTGYVAGGTQYVELTYFAAGGGTGLAGFPASLLTSSTALWATIDYLAAN